MFDTHCHLTDPRLAAQLAPVMIHAADAGVTRMVTIGTSPVDWQPCLEVCRKFAHVRCALGVHPNYCNETELPELEKLRDLQSDPAIVAVGEMGLDYHYGVSKARQREFFAAQLQIAADLKRPIVIHSRQAIDDCLSMLKDFTLTAAVFHCFTGTFDEARRIIEAGWTIGFTGVVTFKKSEELRHIAKWIPADKFLIETDAPYLSPEPKRNQKINEPALVAYTAAAIAAIRGVNVAEIDRLTTENANQFYRWEV